MTVNAGGIIYASDINALDTRLDAVESDIDDLEAWPEFVETNATSSGSAFSTTTTELLSVTASLVDGGVYRISWDIGLVGTTAEWCTLFCYTPNSGGTQLTDRAYPLAGTSTISFASGFVTYTATATGDKTFKLYGVRALGTHTMYMFGAAAAPARLTVERVL